MSGLGDAFPEGTPYTDVELWHLTPRSRKEPPFWMRAGWVMNEETGIREKDGETLNLTFIYDTAQVILWFPPMPLCSRAS